CVMAAAERQRDKKTGRPTGRLSWPTVVLVGGILLSLAANLAQADPSVWGWITAGTPAACFLVAVSMLERRKTTTPAATRPTPRPAAEPLPVPDSFGRPAPSPPSSSSSSGSSSSANSADSSSVPPSSSSPWVVWERPSAAPAAASSTTDRQQDEGEDERGGQTSIPVPVPVEASASSSASSSSASSSSGPAGPLLDFARRVAAEHQTKHGRPITRDALRARLGVSNQLASDLLRHIR